MKRTCKILIRSYSTNGTRTARPSGFDPHLGKKGFQNLNATAWRSWIYPQHTADLVDSNISHSANFERARRWYHVKNFASRKYNEEGEIEEDENFSTQPKVNPVSGSVFDIPPKVVPDSAFDLKRLTISLRSIPLKKRQPEPGDVLKISSRVVANILLVQYLGDIVFPIGLIFVLTSICLFWSVWGARLVRISDPERLLKCSLTKTAIIAFEARVMGLYSFYDKNTYLVEVTSNEEVTKDRIHQKMEEVLKISHNQASEVVNQMAKKEGFARCINSGAVIAAAARLSRKDENRGYSIAVVLPSRAGAILEVRSILFTNNCNSTHKFKC